MSTLITDIRQLRRRPAKAQPLGGPTVGTILIQFETPIKQGTPIDAEDNTVSNRIIDLDHLAEVIDNLAENTEVSTPQLDSCIIEGTTDYERVDELTVVLRRMQAKNANLSTLIESLGLEPVELIQPPGNARLWELAGKALAPGRIYSRTQAIDAIKNGTSVSQDRAELGFKLMLESKAIEPIVDAATSTTHTDLFYLGGSTPY